MQVWTSQPPRRNVSLMTSRFLAVLACAAAFAPPLAAQQRTRPPGCTAAEHRQFDFWIGDWIVETPDGRPAGRNRITATQSGCVVHESWTGAGGGTGESFNIYDRAARRWHQTWVSSTGALLLLEGGLVGDSMVLGNTTRDTTGTEVRNRITYAPLGDGRVRQRWDVSRGGGPWTVVFDGYYRRAPSGS